MSSEFDALEAKLVALLDHCRELRAMNEALREEVAVLQGDNRLLSSRVTMAKARIERLLDRLPFEA